VHDVLLRRHVPGGFIEGRTDFVGAAIARLRRRLGVSDREAHFCCGDGCRQPQC
jgi:hypothetical protein